MVFDYIRPDVVEQIVQKMLHAVAREVEARRGIRIDFTGIRDDLVSRAASDLELGGRGIGNLIETTVVNPLARRLFDGDVPDGAHIAVTKLVEGAGAQSAEYRLECSIQAPTR